MSKRREFLKHIVAGAVGTAMARVSPPAFAEHARTPPAAGHIYAITAKNGVHTRNALAIRGTN
jgi:hypothetical protein